MREDPCDTMIATIIIISHLSIGPHVPPFAYVSKEGTMPQLIFRAFITKPDGTRLYARQYGCRAFPIWVDDVAPDEKDKGQRDD